jgi:hypothetical protein
MTGTWIDHLRNRGSVLARANRLISSLNCYTGSVANTAFCSPCYEAFFFSRVNWPGLEVHQSVPSSTEIKNAWSYNFTPPYSVWACTWIFPVRYNPMFLSIRTWRRWLDSGIGVNGITQTVTLCMLACITPFLVLHEISHLAACVPPSLVALLTMQVIR